MKPLLSSVMLALLSVSAPLMAGMDVEIRLSANRAVAADTLRLGDVAEVLSSDASLQKRLSGLYLGQAPHPDRPRVILRREIASLISRYTQSGAEVTWKGPESVTVERRGIQIDLDKVASVARAALLQQIAQVRPDVQRVTAEATPVATRYLLPAGKLDIRARTVTDHSLRPRMNVWVDISVDGKRHVSLPVWFTVQAHQNVYVLTSGHSRNQPIDVSRLRIEEREVSASSAPPLPVSSRHPTLRARHDLLSGTWIRVRDVEHRPPVVRHQEIAVQVKMPNVQIMTRGLALNDGRLGDKIAVQNPDSGKQYLARVVSDGTVLVTSP